MINFIITRMISLKLNCAISTLLNITKQMK